MDKDAWIADGTSEEEPVTTETPDAQIEPDALPEPTEIEAVETPVEVAEAVEAGAETAEEVAAFIEAKRGDEVYQLPEDVLLPLKRGDEIAYEPVTEVLKRGMMERDYRLNNQTLREERQAFQAERERFSAEQARMEARAQFLEEQERELKDAMTDPAKWAAYQEHLNQYQKNPTYRAHVDRSLSTRETEAELSALRESEDRRIVQQASETARSWISDLAGDFPGVDPNRVARVYGSRLSGGQAQLDRSAVRAIYQEEADYLQTSISPLQEQLSALTEQMAALQAASAAEEHNQKTAHALNRAKAPRVATGSAAPAAVPVAPTKFSPNELADRNSAWVKAG